MRIAVISDLHGNVVALDAVLADLDRQDADRVVCLGDVAAFGPQPRDAMARLRALNCPMVMGNTDAGLLNPQPHPMRDEDTHRVTDIELWSAGQLSPADLDYVRTFQPMVLLPLGDRATLLCFHGSPRSDRDVITSTTPEDDLERLLAGFSATVMAGGHAHQQMLRRFKDTTIINPGSVGLPFEHIPVTDQVRNPPWAEYALVSWEDGNLGITLRRVPVDVDAVIQVALDSGMPHAEWWARDWG